MSNFPLEGDTRTIFDEVMDEIEEELIDTYENLLAEMKLKSMIEKIENAAKDPIIQIIQENYRTEMNEAQKMILGEKISRVVSKIAKNELVTLIAEVNSVSFDLIDELRNELIGEVFEVTQKKD